MSERNTPFQKLTHAIEKSREKLKPFRDHRLKAIEQYVGRHYSEAGPVQDVPVNMIEQAVNIYQQHLAARIPKVLALTEHLGLRASAHDVEMAVNEVLRRIDFDTTLRTYVIEALFSIGIAKVGVTYTPEPEQDGFTHDSGYPFVDVVHLDDWVHDMRAKRWDQIQFCGNMYRVRLEDVKNDDRYDKKARSELSASIREGGMTPDGDVRAETLSQGENWQSEEYKEHIDLWDIWLPREKKIVTFAEDDKTRPLRTMDWEGPENGPYHLLRFNIVPNNIMPLPPIANLYDLHVLINNLYNKLGEQASRQKSLLLVNPRGEKDGTNIIGASDGDAIVTNDPRNAQQVGFGGADQNTMVFAGHTKDLFEKQAGNLNTLGGLATGADTLGQEQMLMDSSNHRMRSMQASVAKCLEGIVTDVAWWMWHDPLIQIPMIRRIELTGDEIETGWPYQRDMQGNEIDTRVGSVFKQYNFRIEPYSMQAQSPMSRAQTLRMILTQDVVPFLEMLQQQGVTVNLEEYLKKIGAYLDLPELNGILQFNQQVQQQPVQSQGPSKPSNTTRNYVRTSKPGGEDQGLAGAMSINSMSGGQQQNQTGNTYN